jgi:hypothetical protein
MSVNNYHNTLFNFPEEPSSHLHFGESLKSRIEERTVDISDGLGLNKLTLFIICESAAKTEMTVKIMSSVSASYMAYTWNTGLSTITSKVCMSACIELKQRYIAFIVYSYFVAEEDGETEEFIAHFFLV